MTTPYNYTVPNWSLLEAALVAASLPKATITEWMWMGEWKQGFHKYKHITTRMYAVLSLGMSRTEMAAAVRSARPIMRICCEECGLDRREVHLLAADNGGCPDPWCCEVTITDAELDRADAEKEARNG